MFGGKRPERQRHGEVTAVGPSAGGIIASSRFQGLFVRKDAAGWVEAQMREALPPPGDFPLVLISRVTWCRVCKGLSRSQNIPGTLREPSLAGSEESPS